MTRVLLAGATGYIGSRVHRRLLARDGVEVRALARRGGDAITSIDLANEPARLADLVAQFQPAVIINCAGTIVSQLDALVSSHVVATSHLLCAAGRTTGARFVQIGSASEYGQSTAEPGLTAEDVVPQPVGAYGVTKLASTQLVAALGRQSGIDTATLRVFNLLGPGLPPSTLLGRVLAFIEQTPASPRLEFGSLDSYRDYVHVDDAADAIVAAAFAAGRLHGEIFNIASGEAVQARTLVRELFDAARLQCEIHETAPGSARSMGVTWQRADISKAARVLGWRPRRSRAEAIRDMLPSAIGPRG